MLKRIFAWLGILGFIFLIYNMTFLHYRTDITAIIYICIIAIFLYSLFNSKK